MKDLFELLESSGIAFERFDHPAVFTCEEAAKLPPMPGMPTKNLFLRDRKGMRHIFVMVGHNKNVDLKALKDLLPADKLSFASPDRLKKYIGVEPGAATILGLIADEDHAVEVIIDEEVWKADSIQCHPLVNTATLVISHEGIEKFLKATGHDYRVMVVPSRV